MKYFLAYKKPSGIFIDNKECDWFFCTQCRTVALSYSCCNNSSCNCGGCEKCANMDISSFTVPTKEQLTSYKVEATEDILDINDILNYLEILDDSIDNL